MGRKVDSLHCSSIENNRQCTISTSLTLYSIANILEKWLTNVYTYDSVHLSVCNTWGTTFFCVGCMQHMWLLYWAYKATFLCSAFSFCHVSPKTMQYCFTTFSPSQRPPLTVQKKAGRVKASIVLQGSNCLPADTPKSATNCAVISQSTPKTMQCPFAKVCEPWVPAGMGTVEQEGRRADKASIVARSMLDFYKFNSASYDKVLLKFSRSRMSNCQLTVSRSHSQYQALPLYLFPSSPFSPFLACLLSTLSRLWYAA